MAVFRSDIERALDDLVLNEEGMRFQGLAVVLAKRRWPTLIASERKRDLGADAVAKPPFATDGVGRILACSITPTIGKLRGDVEEIKKHYDGITSVIFATPSTIANQRGEQWATEIRKDLGLEVVFMEREDIITYLMDPQNASLLPAHLGISVQVESLRNAAR